MRTQRVAHCLAWLACLVTCTSVEVEAQGPAAPKRILLLHQSGVGEPLRARFDVAFVDAVRSVNSISIDLYEETVETRRFPGSQQSWLVKEYLRNKYADRPIDVIVTLANAPLTFARLNREMFGAPAVVAILPGSGRIAESHDYITGLQGGASVQGTIDLAASLLPSTRSVIVVDGARDDTGETETEVERQLKADPRGLRLVFLRNLPLTDLVSRLAATPADSIVLFVRQTMRSVSEDIDQFEALEEVVKASPVPIFSQVEEFMGHGVLGGHVWRFEADARRLADIATRVASGVEARDVPIGHPTYTKIVDWQQLERWNIPESRVPHDATVLFRPQSFFETYERYVIGGLIIFTAQLMLIVGLLVQRVWRRRAEADARRTREHLAHMTRVSAMGELAASLAHELNQPLTAIRANAQAARRLLAAGGPPQGELREILQDIVDDNKRAAEVISRMREMVTKRTPERRHVDVNEVVLAVTKIVASDSIIRQVSLDLDLASEELVVDADRVQLEQVVLNLLLNALDAASMSNRIPHKVVIVTNMSDRNSAHVIIRDNGPGLKTGSEWQVFEPFYTTKGSGMGMGLSIARSIIEAHGGNIWAATDVEQGAEFHVTLPRTAATASTRIA